MSLLWASVWLTISSSQQDIDRQGVVEVCDKTFYDVSAGRTTVEHGPLDGRMGTARKNVKCETCGETYETCNGHFGHVKLALPAFHVGYFKIIVTILQQICKECSHILLSDTQCRNFLVELKKRSNDELRRSQTCKKVHGECKKTKLCPACGAINGTVKKQGSAIMKIIHDKFRAFNTSASQKKVPPKSKGI